MRPLKATPSHDKPFRPPVGSDKILLGFLFISGLVHLSWTLLGYADAFPKMLGDLLFVPGFLLCASLLWRRSTRSEGKAARGWRWFALGTLSWAAGQMYFTVLDNFTAFPPYPSLADLGFFGLIVCFGIGTILLGDVGKGQRVDLRFPLDAMMICLTIGLLYWKLVLEVDAHPHGFQPWIALAYPLGDLVVLLMATLTALWNPRSPVARGFPTLALGLGLLLIADAIYQTQAGTLRYSNSSILNVLWTLSAIALGCWAKFGSSDPILDRTQKESKWPERAEAILTLLPSLGFAVSLWLLLSTRDLPSARGAISLALALIALGIVRHLLSFYMEMGLRRQLKGQASLDTLTGVLNRRQLPEQVAAIIHASQQQGIPSAVLFIDLDRFKRINDAFGHRIGDEVLIEAARRIGRCIRGHDSMARMGGDEFVVLLSQLRDAQEAGLVAQRIIHAVSRPILINDQSFALTASIGIAIYPDDGAQGEALLHHADLAMYAVKQRSRNGYQFYWDTLNVDVQPQLKIEAQLVGALDRGEFQLHYQPLVALQSGEVRSLECLLRWNSPVLGTVSPVTFIPMAEAQGLIVDLGTWILTQAAEQLSVWRAADQPHLCMSINISPVQFEQPAFVGLVASVLDEFRLPGEALLLELTEGSLIQNLEASNVKLAKLRALGVRIALDDFGTGYSSLSYLRQLQVDVLKIDRSFITSMVTEGPAFVSMILHLAQHLDLTTVAEGVETEEQRKLLTSLHCDVGQGYLFSKPLPAEAIKALLAAQPMAFDHPVRSTVVLP
ncbi:putative bifunctional diguanylate cyclase/phosphodiesterase [Deinococcus altitudinis]|uniref:putative bifunctional diguanylate cyclase/phosphodiesterase n=1 Tax=Deinococcus altitudinis TaxID=468914 RepID=UPI0038912F04